MCILQSLKGLHCLDGVRNEDDHKDLKIFFLNDNIDLYRRKWIGHLDRMDVERIP